MEKFSYNLEFYKYNIFDIENVNLFKRKVKEAEIIETYFSTYVPNIEKVRKYIVRSFSLKPKMNYIDRISYIKGLIYADDYINFSDLDEFAEYIENRDLPEETNKSIWWLNGYYDDPEDSEFLENEVENKKNTCLVPAKKVEANGENDYDDDEEASLINFLIENGYYSDFEEDLEDLEPKEKIIKFEENKNQFIDIVLKDKDNTEKETKIIRRAMNDWINFCLSCLNDMYEIKYKSIEYKMENISKFIK